MQTRKTTTTAGIAVILLLMAGLAAAQGRVNIDVPFNENEPPEADPDSLVVEAGTSFEMDVSGAAQVRIFFKDERTPVINRNSGRLVYDFVLNRGMAQVLDVVDRCDDIGCEYAYGIRDLGTPGRPVKDPVIIIGR